MGTVETVDTGSFASNVVLNAFIAGGLQWIWSLVPSQQIIILIPFFSIDLPANALAVFNFKLQIVAFEMIPVEFLTEIMEATMESIRINQRAEKFEPIGFESVWVLSSLGSFLLFFALFPIRLLITLPCLSLLARRWPRFIQKRERVKSSLLWNWPISAIRESYIVIAMASLLNISFVKWADTSDSVWAQINLVIAYILCAFTVLYPLIQAGCLYKNRHML